MRSFQIKMPSKVFFGCGKISELPDQILKYGKDVLIFTGEYSLYNSGYAETIFKSLNECHISYRVQKICGEPTVELIDYLCDLYFGEMPSVIAAIGGGSVIDAAKAVSAMLNEEGSIIQYLENMGDRKLSGKTVPFIAVPTTAGTGSEMTTNAVIAQYSPVNFKRSLRDDSLMPDCAIVDPDLTLGCSYPVTLYSGMDAFCQLLEAYTSIDSNEYTDILMLEGFNKVAGSLYHVCNEGSNDIDSRSNLSFGAMLSGIGIVNSSLTVIHGFASAIGGLYNISHGAICAALVFACTLTNMRRVQLYDPDSYATEKFARIGSILSGIDYTYDKHGVLLRAVTEKLQDLVTDLKIPSLSQLGVKKEDFYKIISATKLNGNPVILAETELMDILEMSF